MAGAADAHHEMAGMSGSKDQGRLSVASKAYLDSMEDMHGDMSAGVKAADPDVVFAQGVIPHYQGAINMAENVISAQKAEIATMQQWLAEHGQKK
ncbi:MAG: DUF305 domain-containing protein [Sodalis sp. (in: enterobacteria)]